MVKYFNHLGKINEFKKLFYIIIFIFILHIIKTEKPIECPKDKPILISGNCELTNCPDSSQCIIANSIIKTQWLNNIRIIGEFKYRYINFASSSENDMIVETTCHLVSNRRILYGLKTDGTPYFTDRITQKATSFYIKDLNNYYKEKLEADALIIKISGTLNNGKEYFMSISKLGCNAEIFDFDNYIVYYKSVRKFTLIQNIKSLRHAFIPLKSSNAKYYYLFGFIGDNDNNNVDKIYFQKHIFGIISNFTKVSTLTPLFNTTNINFIYRANAYGKEVSCFQTENELIICFFLTKEYNNSSYKCYFNFIKYENNLTDSKVKTIESTIIDEDLFNKCIHLKGEVGIFASYSTKNNIIYPYFFVFEYDNEIDKNFKNYLTTTNSTIILEKPNFNYNLLLNDIVKINENKTIFSSTLENKEILYIVAFSFFGEKKVKIRYYPIELYELYHYKILFDLRVHNYNNYLAFGFSFCPNKECDSDDNEHYSALIIFSYPNSIDTSLNLEDYLLNKNNVNIKNLEINLKPQLNLENNIFGYILSNIYIKIIDGTPLEYKAYSSKNISNEIKENYSLKEDEYLIFKYTGQENHFSINKKIEYNCIITEPDYSIYEVYPNETQGDDDINFFKKEEYIGKYTYYNIKSNEELSFVCDSPGCDLCFYNNQSYCLSCKYNGFLNEEIGKSCDIETDLVTENPSELITENPTELITENNEISNEIINNSDDNEYNHISLNSNLNITSNILEQILSSFPSYYYSPNTISLPITSFYSPQNVNPFFNITKLKKDEILSNIPDILKDKEPGQTYKIKGENYIIIIKPSNSTMELNSTNIIFTECESILRKYYNISDSSFITLLQLELYNNYSNSLINQVEYQAYGNNFTKLDLNLCKDANIQIFYNIKDDILLDIDKINSMKNLGFDIFNINDSFFWDVCQPYSNSENDLILEDRIKDLYLNYSLCEKGCTYNKINLENMTVLCDCKVKGNFTNVISELNLDKIKYETSSNFDIIKCYDIIFKFKLKLTNIGFWIFTILIISHFPLLFHYCYTGIQPIYNFVISEMIKFGYLNNNNISQNNNNKKRIISIKNKKKNFGKEKIKTKNNDKYNPPKNKINNKKDKNPIIQNYIFIKNKFIKDSNDKLNSGTKKIKLNKNIGNNHSKRKLKNKKFKIKKKNKKIIDNSKNDDSNYIMKKKNKKLFLHTIQTENPDDKNIENIKKIIDFPLITINLNKINNDDYSPKNSYRILNNYTFEEAIIYDQRSLCEIFFIYLLSKQVIFHLFFYKSPLELFSLRFCLLIFIFSCDLALNAFFYFNDNISKKYQYAKSLFLFTFSNNITVILLSTFVGFILLTLFIKLSNSTFAMRELFRTEEEKIKKDKNYKVTEKRKTEIKNEIEKIFKNYKIKITIFILIELLLMVFFWYFVIIFCHVYPSTQISWLLDSFLSMISRVIIDALICFGLAKLYRISVDSNINCIYKFAMFLYGF